MVDVRKALLDADVHVDVVTEFCEEVVQDALGAKVTTSLKTRRRDDRHCQSTFG